MQGEPGSVRILREVLESALSPAAAAAVVFEGLSAWGERVPVDAAELRAALEGPIRAALDKRLPAPDAEALVRRLVLLLATAEATTDTHGQQLPVLELDLSELEPPQEGSGELDDQPTTPRPRFPDERSTMGLPSRTGPVAVLVLAGTRGFAARLQLAVGPARVAPTTVKRLDGLHRLVAAAAVVVVDGTDIPPIDPETLASHLSDLPHGAVAVVFGSELPFGRTAARALAARSVHHVAIPQREGIEPLIDLVRSLSA